MCQPAFVRRSLALLFPAHQVLLLLNVVYYTTSSWHFLLNPENYEQHGPWIISDLIAPATELIYEIVAA